MKDIKLIIISILIMFSCYGFGIIPNGTYKIEKIVCKSGKELKLGGKFMIYTIFLDVNGNDMLMTANANSGDWAPFKLNCTQTNQGKFTYTKESYYEGDLVNTSLHCNAAPWTAILRKKLFGVESYGEFFYNINGSNLTIYNMNTISKYSCDQIGDYPIYFYKKL